MKKKQQHRKARLFSLAVFCLVALGVFRVEALADVIADRNVYLDSVVEWNPQPAGSARVSFWGWTDENRMPIQNDRALGPPTGTGSWSSGPDSTCVGINGRATWRFEEAYYIFNGPGDDFITFQDNFAWGGEVDGLCNELGRVQVSEDLETWYYNSAEQYIENPDPEQSNPNYSYFAIEGLHGNNPTWANHTKDMQAQEIQEVDGVYKWVDIPGVFVSKDFTPTDPYLGGNGFDLSTFLSVDDESPFPEDGQMRYLRIIDDDTILDGQDYAKPWCLGAHLHAAMGVNVMEASPVPIPGTVWLMGSGIVGLLGFTRKRFHVPTR
jgi:hypothetical protein